MALIWRRVVGLQFSFWYSYFCTVASLSLDAHGHHCIWCFLALANNSFINCIPVRCQTYSVSLRQLPSRMLKCYSLDIQCVLIIVVTGHCLRVPASSKSWSSAGLVRAAVRGRSGRYTRWDPHKLKKSTGLLEPSTDKVTMSVSLKNTNQISRLKYLCFHMTMHKRHIWRPNSVQWCIFVIARVTYVQHSWRWKLEERAPFYFSSNPRALLMLLSLNSRVIRRSPQQLLLPPPWGKDQLLWLPPDNSTVQRQQHQQCPRREEK